ncbi:hypothetical protein HW532_13515 [Kaustia mangrovi]|uniref:Glycosyl transferase family 28 C-terminal domain-containing protein n=1 Tax=Kaustia mangrovi TaxID=2593653 RepID=A0A7S8C560_9HYPH|nr:glycosyltransferase [Kaustia mangrovi]QPC43615.1 hypothetical protein HW532_13515 [Kaustia mangrovi]
MARKQDGHGARILLYSHDTFGLGHLRRCMTIAQSLVGHYRNLSVLILTGSPIIGAYDFRSRVDFVRVPGVIKLRNGSYTSLNLHINIEQTIGLRRAIIERTADVFDPDVMIVDKEPHGLRGEVTGALGILKERGTRLVLGLRDVLDEPELLRKEWRRKKAMEALETFYDEIWVYGLSDLYDPLTGMRVSPAVRDKMVYTGYLKRPASKGSRTAEWPAMIDEDYLLVMTGGGGDGADLVDWVLATYERRRNLPWPALIVLGPFMPPERRQAFQERADRLDNVEILVFHAHAEHLIERARAVVSMGGYNTFCEILTYDKPALIVPRTHPRKEQYIRASRAQELGLARMLLSSNGDAAYGDGDIDAMAEALIALGDQPRPSRTVIPRLMGGLDTVNERVRPWLGRRDMPAGADASSLLAGHIPAEP